MIIALFSMFSWLLLRPQMPVQEPTNLLVWTWDNISYDWQKQILIKWFPEESLANTVANYWYVNGWNDMVLTMLMENWAFDIHSWSPTKDSWLCQLNYRYNKDVINNPEYYTYKFQAEYCLSKWNAVKDKWRIWMAFKVRHRAENKIIYLNK